MPLERLARRYAAFGLGGEVSAVSGIREGGCLLGVRRPLRESETQIRYVSSTPLGQSHETPSQSRLHSPRGSAPRSMPALVRPRLCLLAT